jgi:enoyl-CoA hydratase/methylglutaconyl-CoA hydratase
MSGLTSTTVEGRVGRLRLRRPAKRNALSNAMVDEMLDGVERFVAGGVEVVVLEADPPVFCSGADLTEALDDPHNAAAPRLIDAMLTRPLTWVTAIDGPALGAGVAIAAVSHITIASDDVYFALPEVEIGLFPGGVTAYLEPLVGIRRTFELALTGDRLRASDAARLGLVTAAVPRSAMQDRVAQWTDHLLAQPAVGAASRTAWQARFGVSADVERRTQLETILEEQISDGTRLRTEQILSGANEG